MTYNDQIDTVLTWCLRPGTNVEDALLGTVPAPLVHRDPHDTEVAAALSVRDTTGKLRRQVLGLLRLSPAGLTDDEGGQLLVLQGLTNADRLTFGRRRKELCDVGLVSKSGLRRPSSRGRSAIVWVAHPATDPTHHTGEPT